MYVGSVNLLASKNKGRNHEYPRSCGSGVARGQCWDADSHTSRRRVRPGLGMRPSTFCIDQEAGGRGSHLDMEDGAWDLSNIASGVLNDHVFSAKNIDGSNWCLYGHAGEGNLLTVIPDGFRGDLAPHIATRVSSVDSC